MLHGAVFFRSTLNLESDPDSSCGSFEFVGRHGLPLAPDTEERMERQMPAFEAWVAAQPSIWTPFREILRLPSRHKGPARHARNARPRSHFPELREMEALVIRDFYHRYTVDEHTLVAIETVLDLRGLKGDNFGDLAVESRRIWIC